MTLPSSGPISVAQIATEYNLSQPVTFPNDLWGKPQMPSSGALTIPTDFYGKSNVIFTPNGGTVTNEPPYPAFAFIQLSCNLSATWTYGALPSGIVANHASGFVGTSINFTGTIRDEVLHTFGVTGVSSGVTKNFTLNMLTSAAP